MINLRNVILNRDLNRKKFTVIRSTGGSWVDGEWTEGTPTEIEMQGIVSVANERELNMVAEGDRIKGAMVFHTIYEIFVTRTGNNKGTSDKIVWRGEEYKISNVAPYVDYGYYKGIGVRIKGA